MSCEPIRLSRFRRILGRQGLLEPFATLSLVARRRVNLLYAAGRSGVRATAFSCALTRVTHTLWVHPPFLTKKNAFRAAALRQCNSDTLYPAAVIRCARLPRKFAARTPGNPVPMIQCSGVSGSLASLLGMIASPYLSAVSGAVEASF
jgi:hypothetical protein